MAIRSKEQQAQIDQFEALRAAGFTIEAAYLHVEGLCDQAICTADHRCNTHSEAGA